MNFSSFNPSPIILWCVSPHARTVETQKPRNTHTTIEIWVFVARCWVTARSTINQRHDRCYAMIGAHVSTIEAEFSVCGRRGGYITSSKWSQWQFQFSTSSQFSSVRASMKPVQFGSRSSSVRSNSQLVPDEKWMQWRGKKHRRIQEVRQWRINAGCLQ
jgi:hypothetical protein